MQRPTAPLTVPSGPSTLPASADVVIVGGGVIGCSIAYYLAKAGRSVAVVEQGRIGGAASSAAAGMLTPFAEDPENGPLLSLALQSLDLYRDLAPTLLVESGIDIGLTWSPVLMIPEDDAAAAALKSRASQQVGFDVRWIERNDLLGLEPTLAGEFDGALQSMGQAHVSAPRLVRAFHRAAAGYGARFFESTRIDGLLVSGRRVTGVRTRDQVIEAGVVVLAAGAWTGAFAAEIGTSLPIKPIRGQIVSLLPRGPSLGQICFLGHRYICPKPDGTVLVGSTQDDVGFDASTTVEGIQGLLQLAVSISPELRGAQVVDWWAGLRPGTPDGLPILGPIDDLEGAIVASGHFRRGILLAPATGMAVAQMLADRGGARDLSWLGVGRFRGA